ncbi:hypothetical protein [Undibacterium sp. TS12]|uniref:hypothetical protein n=1 Tax=Undibacterium sp. TS12 TaxID=2908202 RepID=UPI001F4D1876|nr:hypothetical protein [Undibacterium sp. TS12]MCH8618005.1 hypothetical protein [Undibacterium sp. TS12]
MLNQICVSKQAYFFDGKVGAGMKSIQKITTADMLIKLDPVTDFARFQDCLPPLLRLQANLFGDRTASEAEEVVAANNFRALYGTVRSGFDRRKTDRDHNLPRPMQDHTDTGFERRSNETDSENLPDARF